jgi:hypothetical protein
MFRDFGSAPAGWRIRRGATEEREAAGIARQDADLDLSSAAFGPLPAGVPGFEGGRGFGSSLAQNRLDRHRNAASARPA